MSNKTPVDGSRGTLRRAVIACAVSTCIFTGLTTAQNETAGGWVVHPKQAGASVDFGHIHKGQVESELENYGITRTGAYTGASATYDDRLDVSVTLGGLFWYAASNETDPVRRLIRFGAGVGEAQGVYHFGGKAARSARLQVGLFPVAYSPSHNLGEYLYRSGTYPGYLVTGGWSYMQSTAYMAQGARLSFPMWDGKVQHDLTLFMERDINPLGDFSPGYNVTVKPNSFLEVGGGVVWSNALSFRPSRLSPKTVQNAYSKTTDHPVFGADRCVDGEGICEVGQDTLPVGHPDNQFPFPLPVSVYDTSARAMATLADWEDCQTNGDCSDIGYYTFRGFKAMARAAVDVGDLLSMNVPEKTFRVYAEAALLGVQNQPYYYEEITERMPLMMGIDIPTFGILDRLSAEFEYNKSRFKNTIYSVNQNQFPLPLESSDYVEAGGYTYHSGSNTEDDWKWSVYASRQMTRGLNLRAQIASDHMRHPDFWGVMSDEPATRDKSEWYYVVRADFGF